VKNAKTTVTNAVTNAMKEAVTVMAIVEVAMKEGRKKVTSQVKIGIALNVKIIIIHSVKTVTAVKHLNQVQVVRALAAMKDTAVEMTTEVVMIAAEVVTVGVTLTVLMDNEMGQITAMIGNVLNVKTVISHSVRNVTDVVLKKKAEHLALLAKEVTEAVEEMVETETAEIAEEIILVDPITEVVVMKTAWTGIGNVLNAIIITSQEEMSAIDVAWLVQAAPEEILDVAAVAAMAAAVEEIPDAAAVAAMVAAVEEIPDAAAVAVDTVAVETAEEILDVAAVAAIAAAAEEILVVAVAVATVAVETVEEIQVAAAAAAVAATEAAAVEEILVVAVAVATVAEEEIPDAAAVAEEEILGAAAVAAMVAAEEEILDVAAVAVDTVAVETAEEILDVAEETIQHREENQKSQNLEDLKERKMGTLITVPLVKSGHKVTKELEIRRDWNGCRTPLLRCG
jgi:hypothetical protein